MEQLEQQLDTEIECFNEQLTKGEIGSRHRKIRRRFCSKMIQYYKDAFGDDMTYFDQHFEHLFHELSNFGRKEQILELREIVKGFVENKICNQPNE